MTPGEFKALRVKSGLTQEKIADEFGVSARAVQRWESGEFPIPPPVEKLFAILADPEWFRLRVARLQRGEPVGDDRQQDEPRDPLEEMVANFNENLKIARASGELKVAARAVDVDTDDPLGEQVATFNQRIAAGRKT